MTFCLSFLACMRCISTRVSDCLCVDVCMSESLCVCVSMYGSVVYLSQFICMCQGSTRMLGRAKFESYFPSKLLTWVCVCVCAFYHVLYSTFLYFQFPDVFLCY